jgi:YbgC/YbaW family acyl-CoA thioester hydrolase
MSSSITFGIEHFVEFGETDLAGIVHFSNFFRYMEMAETAFLRSLGYTVSWVENNQRIGFPRVSATCEYMQPVHFEDVLEIMVSIKRLGTKSLTYEFEFLNKGALVARGQITSVYCRSTPALGLESAEIPAEMRISFEPYLKSTAESPPA